MAKNNISNELWENFTDELKDVLTFIENTLTYEHPVLTINENYFLLAIFQHREALAYKIIDAIISSTAFNLVHDAYFRLVTKGQLSIVQGYLQDIFSKYSFHKRGRKDEPITIHSTLKEKLSYSFFCG